MSALPKRVSLLFWISLILISGFLTTSILSYWVSRRSMRASITDQTLPLTGDNVYSEIQKDIVRPIFISAEMASNTFLKDWLANGEINQSQLVRYLKEIKSKHNTITAFLVSESTRRYYYADGILETVSAQDPRDNWFFRVRKLQEPFETNVDPDIANRNTMTIFINYRVLDSQGKFMGVTGVGLTLNNMREVVETYEKRFNRRIYFIDKQGNVVLASRAMETAQRSIQQMPGVQELSDQILAGSAKPLSLAYRLKDSTVLVNSRYIPELNWHLVVEQDESDALKPLRSVLFINLAVGAVATALALLLILPRLHLYQWRLEKVATTDALTGLMNRQAFDTLFSEHLDVALRSNTAFAAVLFDIDHFKKINDQHGHLAGDEVIKQVAAIAKQSIRSNDFIARWGGEEFIVLLKGCGLEEAKQVAEKIRRGIAAHDFVLGYSSASVTISLGVSVHVGSETAGNLFARADQALYLAKQKGRNRVESEAIKATQS
jgi:diguanylate cyclase (GGDEF)-like protein